MSGAAGEGGACARAFVLSHGDDFARARLAAQDGDAGARAKALEALQRVQDETGAFAPRGAAVAGPGNLAGTLAALAALDALHALGGGREVAAAARWLAGAQADDGSWGPDGAGASARIVWTGLLAGFLARTASVRPAVLRAAGGFLADRWDAGRLAGGDFGALAAFAHFFANQEHELSDSALQRCGRELEHGVRTGRLSAWQAARVLTLCDAHGLPGARLGAAEVRELLWAQQAADGAWPGAEAPLAWRVDATLDALRALARFPRPAEESRC